MEHSASSSTLVARPDHLWRRRERLDSTRVESTYPLSQPAMGGRCWDCRCLSEALRLLVPGGRLAVSVPNYASFTQRVLGRRDRYVGIDHLNYFTVTTIKRLLERHGFQVETVRTDRFSPVVFWQDLKGVTPDGASLEQQLADMTVTDRFKYGRGGFAAVRLAHRAVKSVLAAVGLGDLLCVVARKSHTG